MNGNNNDKPVVLTESLNEWRAKRGDTGKLLDRLSPAPSQPPAPSNGITQRFDDEPLAPALPSTPTISQPLKPTALLRSTGSIILHADGRIEIEGNLPSLAALKLLSAAYRKVHVFIQRRPLPKFVEVDET